MKEEGPRGGGEGRGGTQKAFKSLDESPGSNEPGFLVRDLWYS
jgi:hypothetical protein